MEHIVVTVPSERHFLLESGGQGQRTWLPPVVGLGVVAFLGLGAMWWHEQAAESGTRSYAVHSATSATRTVQATLAPRMPTTAATFQRAVPSGPQASLPASTKQAVEYGDFTTSSPNTETLWPIAAVCTALFGLLTALSLRRNPSTLSMLAVSGESNTSASGDKKKTPEAEVVPSLSEDPASFDYTAPDFGDDDDFTPFDEPAKAGEAKVEPKDAKPEDTERTVGAAEQFGFETNTRQILDIVAHSLYSDKEVFIRELISNASDAIEKCRYTQLISDVEIDVFEEPKIQLFTDEENRKFIIQDTGIGMTKEELLANLGTIASSGSKGFLEKMKEAGKGLDATDMIGQFGVGFYSAFIVADRVKVFTKSAIKGSQGYLWESDGTGDFTITEADGVRQGTKIVVELKESEVPFAQEKKIKEIVKKYSNFIGSPIFLNGNRQNTVEALWRKKPSEVTDEEHAKFYKFLTGAFDKPQYRVHYKVDAPIDVKAMFYVPEYNMEQPGRNRLQSQVNLYCRKVLIQAQCKNMLPEWMRFISGVVDSEDLPLNISRENTQDSQAFKKLSRLVTKRIIKWLADEANKDKEKYNKFWQEFGYFIKEGGCTDKPNQPAICKLLRFESSALDAEKLTSFDGYIERFVEGQKAIYFLHSPSRDTAVLSPYYEQFKKKGIEVIFMYGQLDEYLMGDLQDYKGTKLISVENSDVDLDGVGKQVDEDDEADDEQHDGLSESQSRRFKKFLLQALTSKISDCQASTRLTESPAVIAAGFEQAAVYRHMKQVAVMQGKKGFGEGALGQQVIEYNPKHPIIQKLYWLSRSTDDASQAKATQMAEQVYDNALIAAGLMDDPRLMLNRLNSLLEDSMSDVEIGEEADEPIEPEPEVVPEPPKPSDAQSAEMTAKLDEMLKTNFKEEDAAMIDLDNILEDDPREAAAADDIQDATFTEENTSAGEGETNQDTDAEEKKKEDKKPQNA
jgi:TNF receptor-associated protein 1